MLVEYTTLLKRMLNKQLSPNNICIPISNSNRESSYFQTKGMSGWAYLSLTTGINTYEL